MKTVLTAFALILSAGAGWGAECVGKNLIEMLNDEDRAWLETRTDAVPYSEGVLWRASKGGARITMVGTYHFDHPMHAATVAALRDDIAAADRLMVELGPEEEAQLTAAMLGDPTLTVDLTGPTLPEQLSAAQWKELGDAMEDRGIPAVMASRMRPWYVATLLAMSPCAMKQLGQDGASNGLDRQLIQVATDANVPVAALEPWDTVIKLFNNLTPEEAIDMIVYTLPVAAYADNYTSTMEDAYAAGSVWEIWEFGRLDAYHNSGLSREEVDELTDASQKLLMDDRNLTWIAPLTEAAEKAAARDKAIVAAFGALHLAGENGVLRLLEKDGWTVERIE